MRKQSRRVGVLAALIQSHYGAATPQDEAGKPAPRLRLQDWRVVDEVSIDATYYVLLRRIDVPRDDVDSLTAREREAVRHACTGASNKEIAFSMEISASTVGVLLWRAARKLGAEGREGLVRAFRSQQP